jgi:hypothetical protein
VGTLFAEFVEPRKHRNFLEISNTSMYLASLSYCGQFSRDEQTLSFMTPWLSDSMPG